MTLDRQTQQDLTNLTRTVRDLVDVHQRMVTLLDRKTDAMRKADGDAMQQLSERENELVQLLSNLEKRRLQQVADITLRVDPAAPEPLRMKELAERLPEPTRGKLLVMRTQLLDAMEEVKTRTSVARRASESLLKHMTGLLHHVTTAATGSRTYGRRGPGPQPSAYAIPRTLNLTA